MKMQNHGIKSVSIRPGSFIHNASDDSWRGNQALAGLTPADQQKFETYGRGPVRELPYETIHTAIERQAIKRGESIAARHKEEHITYSELNRQADLLANLLIKQGVKEEDNVGLFLERSIPMLVGILGILKAGATYVPQDARITPEKKLEEIISSARIKVILTLSHLAEKIPVVSNQTVLSIDQLKTLQPNSSEGNHLALIKPRTGHHSGHIGSRTNEERNSSRNCFILFTSGTTGKPNGVQVTHKNVCNILLTEPGNLSIQPGDKVSQLLNIAFDMAAWEILGCLSHGGTLIIREKDLTEAASQCNVIVATPSILARIDHTQCQHIKTVAVAGEPCPRALAETWAQKCHFINSCGPTETTIINTAQHFQAHSPHLTIGKPTPNNTVYILDDELQPCAIGEVGEIWAGGQGVSSGYINNFELTEDRYRHDPFMNDGSFMFRTRDLGRWNNDGELEHFGRTDDQVKIKGFRVELDSVSTTIESVDTCQQAVTLKLNNEELIAFVRPADVNTDQCLNAIRANLPYYCEPSSITALSEFPVTSRGKIDKQALLAQVTQNRSTAPEKGAIA